MKQYTRVYAKIDLDAIAYNMEQMKERIGTGAKLVAVIKTDGYGHGAIPIARMFESVDYVWGYATASLDEAVLLRKAGICKPILVLGCVFPDQYEDMIRYEVRPATYTEFVWMKQALEERNLEIPYIDCDNSAGIIDFPNMKHNLARAGISLYGMYPSDEVNKDAISLKPALELISHISFVKNVEAGTSISYGGTFVAPKAMRIATIPVGYGDGYPRSLSNKGAVLIHGKRARILGRVCMDQFLVDLIMNLYAALENESQEFIFRMEK